MMQRRSPALRTSILLMLVTVFAACAAASTDAGETVNGRVTADSGVATLSVTAPSGTMTVGGNQVLTVAAFNSAGQQLAGRTASWSSSAANVATVSNEGRVSALAMGTVDITATVGGRSSSTRITVR
jgi:uncharacterized protein YjdB